MESPRVLRERKPFNYSATPFKKPRGPKRNDPFITSLEDSPAMKHVPRPAEPYLQRNIFQDTNIPDEEDEAQMDPQEPFYIIDWLSDLSIFPYITSFISVVASLVVILFLGIFQIISMPYNLALTIRTRLTKRAVYYIKTSLLILSMVVLLLFLFTGKDVPVKLLKQNDTKEEFKLPDILKHPLRGGAQKPEIADLESGIFDAADTNDGAKKAADSKSEFKLPDILKHPIRGGAQKPDLSDLEPVTSQNDASNPTDAGETEQSLGYVGETDSHDPIQAASKQESTLVDSPQALVSTVDMGNMEEIKTKEQFRQQKAFDNFKQEFLNLQDIQEIHIENILQRLDIIELELNHIESIKSEIRDIKQLVEKDQMKRDLVKKFGPNYALSALGATVKSSKPIRSKTNNPSNMLQGNVTPGKCFGVGATNSFVEIQLPKKINVKAVILRHLNTYSMESKPKELLIMGRSIIFEKEHDLLLHKVETRTDAIRIDIKNNWGKDYTCLYSVEVHGVE
ncbi:hypothetical protein HDV01_006437 [Terramyces sp. JEL0728]|nr:hypothetical protein HDV01_006437 [Terramyces sp. JEL0728]